VLYLIDDRRVGCEEMGIQQVSRTKPRGNHLKYNRLSMTSGETLTQGSPPLSGILSLKLKPSLTSFAISLVAIFGLPGKALCDIAPHPEVGISVSVPGEVKTDLVMSDENVQITVYRTASDISAQFHIRNTGAATTTKVGFPEVTAGNGPLSGFKVTIDGEPVSFTSEKLPAPRPWHSLIPWKVWTMKFAPNQQREILVSYRALNGMENAWNHGMLDLVNTTFHGDPWANDQLRGTIYYILVTGSYWKSPIGRCVVAAHLKDGLSWKDNNFDALPKPTSLTDREAVWEWRDIEPKQNIEMFYVTCKDIDVIAHLEAIKKAHPDDVSVQTLLDRYYKRIGKKN